jgi:EAL domain-containing protein (putative c-di-GMP-specific phosphodiesterase class I)
MVERIGAWVETEDQLTLARAAGCTQAQGFLFGKPRPLSEFDVERAGWYRAGEAA